MMSGRTPTSPMTPPAQVRLTSRRSSIARVSTLLTILMIAPTMISRGVAETPARPNIVWIMSEDNSKHYLQHFDPTGVETPAIEAMASQGVTFDRAFSNAPVCSVARTTLITGCYGPRIGTQYHRKSQSVPMPEGLEMFPAYLKEAGYYTTNNAKEDYNATPRQSPWNESGKKASWKRRPSEETPFFHVQTFTDSHESRLHFGEDQLNQPTVFPQDKVALPGYLPNTPLFRYTAAYYRDRMQVIDEQVQSVIDQLETSKQLENTFVFYFGDHGGVLPRSKGYLFESGLHVPLVIRIPENYRSLTDRKPGTRTQGFVSFIDFAPTVLKLAGLEVPDEIDGRAFLGNDVAADEVDQRNTSFSYADRMDEKYDLVRAVRVGDWKYIRYFEAQYPNAFHNDYRYQMLAYQQWRQLSEEGELSPEQDAFFRPRPVEVLFDLSQDPDETSNLAGSPEHGSRLIEMRQRLMSHLKEINDLGFCTEAVFLSEGGDGPVSFGLNHHDPISVYIDTANIAVQPIASITAPLIAAINSGDSVIRHWGLVAASSVSSASLKARQSLASDETVLKLARRRTMDESPMVAARAAEFLAILELDDPCPTLYRTLEQASSETEALQILNIAAFLRSDGRPGHAIEREKINLGFQVSPKSKLQIRLDYFDSLTP